MCVRVQSERSTCLRMEERCGTSPSCPRSTTSSSTPCCQPMRTWYSCTWTTQEVGVDYDDEQDNKCRLRESSFRGCKLPLWFLYSASLCVCFAQTLAWEPYMCQTTEGLCSPSLWSAIFTQPQEATPTSQPLLHSGASTWPVYSQRVSQHCACVRITAKYCWRSSKTWLNLDFFRQYIYMHIQSNYFFFVYSCTCISRHCYYNYLRSFVKFNFRQ